MLPPVGNASMQLPTHCLSTDIDHKDMLIYNGKAILALCLMVDVTNLRNSWDSMKRNEGRNPRGYRAYIHRNGMLLVELFLNDVLSVGI